MACALAAVASCGQAESSPADAPAAPTSFVAFARDFDGYERWQGFPLGVSTPAEGEIDGPRTIFASRIPAPGTPEFPVGTLLVKEIGDGPVAERQVFGMAKRGGDYNAFGAKGWEWFELKRTADGALTIDWRGIAPPEGKGYGTNIKGGACNDCHASLGAANDAVLTPALTLGTQ